MDENPFPELMIDSTDFLDTIQGRSKCSKCKRSRKYYCYTCYIPVPEILGRVPKLKLPLKIDIIKHPSEVDGKSTAIHAGVIAPDDVTIYTYPVIPDYQNKEKIVLVFPGENSTTLSELAAKHRLAQPSPGRKRKGSGSNEKNDRNVLSNKSQKILPDGDCTGQQMKERDRLKTRDIVDNAADDEMEIVQESNGADNHLCDGDQTDWCLERVVFIDSTWNQTKSIYGDERLKDLQCVQLSDRKTKFWRHHNDNPDTYLSTIEAIYYFLRDYHVIFVSEQYNTEYDNLLFFFTYMYKKIRHLYDGGGNLLAYRKKIEQSRKPISNDEGKQ